MKKNILASEIALFLEKELHGPEILVQKLKSINNFEKNSMSFLIKDCDVKVFSILGLLIIKDGLDLPKKIKSSYIISENPRLEFAKVIDKFFDDRTPSDLRNNSYISDSSRLADDVIIGSNCFIGENVEIGPGSTLNHNIVIADNTIIGKDCYIKSGTVIGEDGFGFDFDENRTPFRIPHIGRVVIFDGVEIGANNTVVRATLGETVIGKNTKTDDHVHIAHNCVIEKNCIITACAELSGSVTLGQDVWVGPNASIMNNIKIGDYAMIGLGSVVTQSVSNFSLVAGSPAKSIGWLSKSRKKLELPLKAKKEITTESENVIYSLIGSKLKIK
jgi:UDP-3-O-[3-hydroxymyristoyl] glucosamine N-acyltransferase